MHPTNKLHASVSTAVSFFSAGAADAFKSADAGAGSAGIGASTFVALRGPGAKLQRI